MSENETFGLNIKALVSNDIPSTEEVSKKLSTHKRGPGRPPSDPSSLSNVSSVHVIKPEKNKDDEIEKDYKATTALLLGVISQSDSMYVDIENEIDKFKNPRFGGKNKLLYETSYRTTQTQLLNTKVSAIRELNSSRNKINDIKFKRMQLNKEINSNDSDKYVMDAYNAFINASKFGLPAGPSQINPVVLNTPSNNTPTPTIVKPDGTSTDSSFNNYVSNLTPEQKRMIVGNDPNIKTVVVYDQSTGNRYFDVINVKTGLSVPGVARPSETILDGMRININNCTAENSNLNKSYPLVLFGSANSNEV